MRQLKKEAFTKEASKWKAVKAEQAKKLERKGPKEMDNLMEAEKKTKDSLLNGISTELRSSRYIAKVCIRCGIIGHRQYTCRAPKPVSSSTTLKRKRSTEAELKVEPMVNKMAGLNTGSERMWEIPGSDEEMEE